ncbi:MAG: hypothetical protein EOO09_15170 [Chitinophagaceae bacterium]|nr:MAG: hypothetical protein EOO09_15170 [Chitinophagaceae bacterium]
MLFKLKLSFQPDLWESLALTVLTLFAILNGQTTVFYVIYLFWWHELIRVLIDRVFRRPAAAAAVPDCQPESRPKPSRTAGSLILLAIYFVFIVVIFGFMSAWNTPAFPVNMQVLFFRNMFFNAALVLTIARQVAASWFQPTPQGTINVFTANIIILHISIILGGVLLFFVVNKFPAVFSPDNFRGSVIIILPFFLMRIVVYAWVLKCRGANSIRQ